MQDLTLTAISAAEKCTIPHNLCQSQWSMKSRSMSMGQCALEG